MFFKRPYFYYSTSTYGKWLSDGITLYRYSDVRELFDPGTSIQEASDIDRQAITRQEFNYGATDVLINSTKKEYLGKRQLNGKEFLAIKVTTEFNEALIFYFDEKEDYLLRAYGSADFRYVVQIDQYKKFNNLLVPEATSTFINDRLECKKVTIEFSVNGDIPDNLFDKASLKK